MNKVLVGYYAARKTHDRVLSKLDKEFCRIIDVIKTFFGQKNAWFAYDYYEDADDDDPLPRPVEDNEAFVCYISQDCSTDEWDYSEAFPIKFFDMTNGQIKEYLAEEKERGEKVKLEREQKEAAVKVLREQAKAKKKMAVLKKLTAEERKVLGV